MPYISCQKLLTTCSICGKMLKPEEETLIESLPHRQNRTIGYLFPYPLTNVSGYGIVSKPLQETITLLVRESVLLSGSHACSQSHANVAPQRETLPSVPQPPRFFCGRFVPILILSYGCVTAKAREQRFLESSKTARKNA
jgi:hypothetical protein